MEFGMIANGSNSAELESGFACSQLHGFRYVRDAHTFKICHPERLFFFAGEEEPSRRIPVDLDANRNWGIGMLRLFELPQAEAQLHSA
jgi:hypothetical protein